MSKIPSGEGQPRPEPNNEEEVEGIKAGYVREFFKTWQDKLGTKGHGQDHVENERTDIILESIQDLLEGNPYLTARRLYIIESIIYHFVDHESFDANNGREGEIAIQIATYLNTLPSAEKGK